jgi:hypothetical protein
VPGRSGDLCPRPSITTRAIDRHSGQALCILTETGSQVQRCRQVQLITAGSQQLLGADEQIAGDYLPLGMRRLGRASFTVTLTLCATPARRVAVVLGAPAPAWLPDLLAAEGALRSW